MLLSASPEPNMIPAAVAVAGPSTAGAVLCSISLVASARPMRIDMPKLPDIKLPELKLPQLDLPNFGKKGGAAKAKPAVRTPAPRGVAVKVRAARGVVPTAAGATDAPSFADITGEVKQDSIAAGAGYKRFPARRMPGAMMDDWRKIAKDIAPKV